MNTILYTIPNVVSARVVARPSKTIKSPYVADLNLDANDTPCLGHTAGLGCGGLANAGAHVWMTPTAGNKCDYRMVLSRTYTNSTPVFVGIFPKLAEELVANALRLNCIPTLANTSSVRRETSIHIEGEVHSRFDFSGVDETGREFVLEVKSVPLAHEVVESGNDGTATINSNRAYFPDGYRKHKTDTVSERALKHVRELQRVLELQNKRTILCFVVQRDDVDAFETSPSDPQYRDAVREAHKNGVEVIVLHVKWTVTPNNEAVATCMSSTLPIYL